MGKMGGEFIRWRSLNFLPIDARKYFALWLSPSGPTTKRAIDARNDMSCLRHSPGPIVTPRRIIGRSTDYLAGFYVDLSPKQLTLIL